MTAPDLEALRRGDVAAWDEAFPWLWQTAFPVARLQLDRYLPGEVQDVAIEAIEAVVEEVARVNEVEELKRLVASIAHRRAVDRLRRYFTDKRGGGKTESLEAKRDEDGDLPDAIASDSPLATLSHKELADRLGRTMAGLKPQCRELLGDFHIDGLAYEEIARKRGVAMGSVGVFLKRGLDALRRAWGGDRE
jgi:RNA polymerase sigma factor (sigma-70 family)